MSGWWPAACLVVGILAGVVLAFLAPWWGHWRRDRR